MQGGSRLQKTTHNPDRYMVDLRQIISQGKKRIGLLIGAGAPVAVRVDENNALDNAGNPIIPDVAGLTTFVLAELDQSDSEIIEALRPELGDGPNIETILTKIRRLSEAIGKSEIHGLDGNGYKALGNKICQKIGERVAPKLPLQPNPYTEIVSWIGGISRDHPVEIFTPNYDLLIEEAFERALLPFFDGFSGSHKPFFDPASIANDSLPSRWSRLWKIHGSLGWDVSGDTVVRGGSREAATLIYPDHLKYDEITRQPYSALFERLKKFLTTPDSLLICCGFSFFDAHICAVIDEALEANKHTSLLAFQFKTLEEEKYAVNLSRHRPNMSVYAQDGAIVFGIEGSWSPGEPPSDEWLKIRQTFWQSDPNGGSFLLGDFAKLSRFFALSQASEFSTRKDVNSTEEATEETSKDLSAIDTADGGLENAQS